MASRRARLQAEVARFIGQQEQEAQPEEDQDDDEEDQSTGDASDGVEY